MLVLGSHKTQVCWREWQFGLNEYCVYQRYYSSDNTCVSLCNLLITLPIKKLKHCKVRVHEAFYPVGGQVRTGTRILETILYCPTAHPPKVVLGFVLLSYTHQRTPIRPSWALTPWHRCFPGSPLQGLFLSVIIQIGWRLFSLQGHERPGPAFWVQYLCWLALKGEERITYCRPESCKRFQITHFPSEFLLLPQN